MATSNVNPRANLEGKIGISGKRWAEAFIEDLNLTGDLTDGPNTVTVAELKTAVDATAGLSYGELFVSASAATTIAAVNTPIKAAGTTTLGETSNFDDDTGTNNRLRYTGADTKKFTVHIAATFSPAGSNNIYAMVIAKNGVVVAKTEIVEKMGTSGDERQISTQGIIELALNDYVEIWIENQTNANNITMDKAVFHALQI